MCNIIYRDPAVAPMPTYLFLLNIASDNPDGFGAMWSAEGKLHTVKSLRFDRAMYDRLPTDVPLLLHFRWKTHGQISEANCHPFQFTGRDGDYALMHNGVLSVRPSNPEWSDTREFIESMIKPAAARKGFKGVKRRVKRVIASDRIALLRHDGRIEFFGGWQKRDDGIWTSSEVSLTGESNRWRYSTSSHSVSRRSYSYGYGAGYGSDLPGYNNGYYRYPSLNRLSARDSFNEDLDATMRRIEAKHDRDAASLTAGDEWDVLGGSDEQLSRGALDSDEHSESMLTVCMFCDNVPCTCEMEAVAQQAADAADEAQTLGDDAAVDVDVDCGDWREVLERLVDSGDVDSAYDYADMLQQDYEAMLEADTPLAAALENDIDGSPLDYLDMLLQLNADVPMQTHPYLRPTLIEDSEEAGAESSGEAK